MRFPDSCTTVFGASEPKTAPNIGEVSLVSAIYPLLEWNVPVLPMARQLRAPQTLGPMHSVTLSPPLVTPLLVAVARFKICIPDKLNQEKTYFYIERWTWPGALSLLTQRNISPCRFRISCIDAFTTIDLFCLASDWKMKYMISFLCTHSAVFFAVSHVHLQPPSQIFSSSAPLPLGLFQSAYWIRTHC